MRAHFGLPSVEKEEEEGRPPIGVKFEIPYFTVSGIQVREMGRVALLFDLSRFPSLPPLVSGHLSSVVNLAFSPEQFCLFCSQPGSPLPLLCATLFPTSLFTLSLSHPQAVDPWPASPHPPKVVLCLFPYTVPSLSGPPFPFLHSLCPCHIFVPSRVTSLLPDGTILFLPAVSHVFPWPQQALSPQVRATSFHFLPGPIHEDHREKRLPGPALGPLHHPEWW